jgi:DNA invertase Pin-like site-specific DNA recombinase
VSEFCSRHSGSLKAEFTEVQSGKDDERPQLKAALRHCRLTNATLLIAKLDRLSRNVAFLAALQQSGTRFIACDLPEANELVVHILAAVAQAERKAISDRTRAALAAAKSRGVRLGNPHLKPGNATTAAAARRERSRKARQRAIELMEIVEDARSKGIRSLRGIAEHLDSIGVAAPRGGKWHPNSVRRITEAGQMPE